MATVDKNFRVKNGLVVEGTTGTINGNNIVTDADTTDILAEGTSNLYFTDQRAKDAVTGGVDTDGISEGTTNLYFTDGRVQDVLVNAVQENIAITSTDGVLFITAENGVEDSTTDDLDEGTVNLYFTAERVLDVVSGGGEGFTTDSVTEGSTNLYFTDERAVSAVVNGDVDTDDIEEGTTNLYYTDARVEDVIAASDTDDLSEGSTNLYYTDSRARSAISGSTGITYSSTDGVIFVDTETIATVEYVNATAEGLHVHTSVATATTANIADLSSPPATIDGVTLTEGMRVLVKDQETLSQNGIYVVDSGALVRAEDHDTATEVRAGDFVFVSGGDTQAATGYVQINEVSSLGTDPIEWTQFIGAGVFTAGEGLDLTGNVFSLDATTDLVDEGTTNLYFTDQRAVDAVINGAVDTDDIEEGTTNLYYTDARVEDVIAASDTDDLSEGTTNLYFTTQRAIDAVASGDFDTDVVEEGTTNLYYTTQRVYDDLVNSVQENIVITTTDGLLYITAENGVADSTTDDLVEGTTNLYFTDQRAVDALEAVTPNFTEIEINSVSKQVAATVNVADAETPTVAYSFDGVTHRSAKFIVKAAHGSHTEISEILLTLDSSDNVAITEYAIVSTNGNLIDVTAAEATGDVQIIVEAVNANTVVTVFGTLIA
jgi:hypothetical protein